MEPARLECDVGDAGAGPACAESLRGGGTVGMKQKKPAIWRGCGSWGAGYPTQSVSSDWIDTSIP